MERSNLAVELRAKLESLKTQAGAYRAAPSVDYSACWLRDHLYTTYCFWYLGDYEALKDGMGVAFDILSGQRHKLERISPPEFYWDHIHAKYDAETLGEVTRDWGHHQLDALGLFLYMTADLDFKHISVLRNSSDREILQLLVFYLLAVRYWERPDFGMWEVAPAAVRSSSLGSVVRGLSYLRERQLAVVPEELIALGRASLVKVLPEEFPGRPVDLAQLSLIWPYNVLSGDLRDEVLRRVDTALMRDHGVARYLGDTYYHWNEQEAQWPMGFFWRSIIASQMNDCEGARIWFERGLAQATRQGEIPELYSGERPNEHTPLAWAHSLAIIALMKKGLAETK